MYAKISYVYLNLKNGLPQVLNVAFYRDKMGFCGGEPMEK